MENLLWLDGHISSISEEEAELHSYEEPIERFGYVEYVYVLHHNAFKFEWDEDIWLQI